MDYPGLNRKKKNLASHRIDIPLNTPIKLSILSIATITLIMKLAPERLLNTPGFVNGAVGVLYAIVPGYTTYYWITGALRRISKDITTVEKFKITGVILGCAGIIGVHTLMMWKLCSVPIREKDISIFWGTILSDLLLFIVWEIKNRTKSPTMRDALKFLLIVVLIVCLTLYLSNLVKMFGKSDLRMFTTLRRARTNTNADPVTSATDEEGGCPICLGKFDDNNPAQELSCGHSLHGGGCYSGLMNSGDRRCPICRRDVT